MKRLKQIVNIIEGKGKRILGIQTSYESDRLLICSICDLNKGGVCSKELGGCGCTIKDKVKCKTCKCPLKKW